MHIYTNIYTYIYIYRLIIIKKTTHFECFDLRLLQQLSYIYICLKSIFISHKYFDFFMKMVVLKNNQDILNFETSKYFF